MPLYLLVFGLRMRQAVGTGLLVIAVLSIPTLLTTHWALGDIDFVVAGAFAAGSSPAATPELTSLSRFTGGTQRRAFGYFLIGFGSLFTLYRLLANVTRRLVVPRPSLHGTSLSADRRRGCGSVRPLGRGVRHGGQGRSTG